MEYSYYESYINKNTIGKYDTTPIFANAQVLQNLIEDLARPFKHKGITHVIGLEALGFILAVPVAVRLGAGFVPIRKIGKIPTRAEGKNSLRFVDYSKTEKGLEINNFILTPTDKVLLIDDWMETGTQIKAAVELITKTGATVVGISLLAAEKNEKTKELFQKYDLHTIGLIE